MPVEAPRDVFIAACAAISHPFTDRGFRFAKSGPHTVKNAGEFRYRIGFASTSKNMAGVSVRMWISGRVLSPKLKAWRKTYSELQPLDYVAGCQLQNLTEESVCNVWDFANQVNRQSMTTAAVQAVDSVVLPYFSQFDDLDSIIQTLQQRDICAMPINRVIEFLICFAGADAARNAGARFLIRNPQFVRNYQRDFTRYAERGIHHKAPSSHAGHLAFASHLFELGNLCEKAT